MKKIFTLAAMFAAVALVSCAEQAQKENAEETTAPAVEATTEAPAPEATAETEAPAPEATAETEAPAPEKAE